MRHSLTFTLFIVVLLATSWARAQDLTSEERHMVDLVNAARSEAGLGPVQADRHLSAVARGHSTDMAQNNYFAHESPTTGDMGDRLRSAGVLFGRAAENIAIDHTVAGAHEAFMTSPHHRANVLDGEYTHVGIGIVRAGERFVVTQAFMRPRSRPGQPATAEAVGSGASCPARSAAPEAATPAQEPVAPSPRAAAPSLASPFDLLGLLTGGPQESPPAAARPRDEAREEAESGEGQNADESPSRTENEDQQAPGLWLVGADGTRRRIELDADALMRLLNAL